MTLTWAAGCCQSCAARCQMRGAPSRSAGHPGSSRGSTETAAPAWPQAAAHGCSHTCSQDNIRYFGHTYAIVRGLLDLVAMRYIHCALVVSAIRMGC